MAVEAPVFTIAPEARELVREVHFDGETFAAYLLSRDVPEEEISKLDIGIGGTGLPMQSRAGFMARDSNNPDERHRIEFSPRRLTDDTAVLGKLLRSHSEHFIYWNEHPNYLRNRQYLMAGFSGLMGFGVGYAGLRAGLDLSEDLPMAAQIPLSTVMAAGGTAVGAVSGAFEYALVIKEAGPTALRAHWAARRRKNELPDGVLQIELTTTR